ncbi:hypothetical protein KIK06_08160 [Nocardiopsis sp. EMB25]|uniref:hypothetical protein n=1 Tax=Nocardiopsis sp. EMB25 TaxID=2835867 RepID=UPI0022851E48|nr:hypothetical protein [Nocardiopsis sp. EMB25]MCY9783863.1 hypothetical protein [Nocardiopsis sp. EMB25]
METVFLYEWVDPHYHFTPINGVHEAEAWLRITRDEAGWWVDSLGGVRSSLLNGARGAADLARWMLEPLRADWPVHEKDFPVVERAPVGPVDKGGYRYFEDVEIYIGREALNGPECLSVQVMGIMVRPDGWEGGYDPNTSPECPSIDRPALDAQARGLLAAAEGELDAEHVTHQGPL